MLGITTTNIQPNQSVSIPKIKFQPLINFKIKSTTSFLNNKKYLEGIYTWVDMGSIMTEATNCNIYSHRLIYRVLILHFMFSASALIRLFATWPGSLMPQIWIFFRMLLYKQDTLSIVFLSMDHLCVHVLSQLLLGNWETESVLSKDSVPGIILNTSSEELLWIPLTLWAYLQISFHNEE